MHILVSVNKAWNIWNFRRNLVKRLLAEGHLVTILAPADDTVPALKKMGCRFHPLEMSVKGLNPFDDIKLSLNFRKIFKDLSPDIVLSYTIKNNIFGALAAKSLTIPFIPNVTGLGTAFLSTAFVSKIAQFLYKSAFKHLPTIFFQNQDDADLFLDLKLVEQRQVKILPGSGINTEYFFQADYPESSQRFTFLMVARLLVDKGVVEFVDAARIISNSRHDARFQLLGAIDTDNRTAIAEETLQAWIEEGLVEYLGKKDDVRPYIAASHCVVLPSYREGAPRSLLEAASMGRPIITTDVPGCRSVVDAGASGYLCAVQNAVSLAQAMADFLTISNEEKLKMGYNGRKKIEREFDESFVIDAYLKEIAQLTPA